jgi:hypothetical protein
MPIEIKGDVIRSRFHRIKKAWLIKWLEDGTDSYWMASAKADRQLMNNLI